MPVLTRRRLIATWSLFTLSTAGLAEVNPAAPAVIATFSILDDLARNVGGDRIDVSALVGPNGDTHVYSPSPADAKKLLYARAVFANGLGFEG